MARGKCTRRLIANVFPQALPAQLKCMRLEDHPGAHAFGFPPVKVIKNGEMKIRRIVLRIEQGSEAGLEPETK